MQYSAGTDNQRCTPTHVLAVNHTSPGTHTMQRACGPCVGSAHIGVPCLLDTRERERDGVCDFPFLALLFVFLLLTVRWMIAITGAISETEWRSMGQ